MRKRKYIFKLGTCMIVLTIVTAIILSIGNEEQSRLSPNHIEELRQSYPLYNKAPDWNAAGKSIDTVLKYADAFVVGEVVKQLPDYEVPKPYIDQSTKHTITYHQYEFKVKEHITGNPVADTTIITSSSNFKGYEVELKPGMQVVISLWAQKGRDAGKYGTSKFAFFYIVEDNYVISAVDENYEITSIDVTFEQNMNGQKKEQLIKEIKKLKRESQN